jgi:hypothetical protein
MLVEPARSEICYYTHNSNYKRSANQNFKFQIYVETVGRTFQRASSVSEGQIEKLQNLELRGLQSQEN